YEAYLDCIAKDQTLAINAEASFDDYSPANTMTAREVMTLVGMREQYANRLRVTLHQQQLETVGIESLKQLLEPYRAGVCPLHICYQRPDVTAVYAVTTDWYVTPTDELMYELQQQFGEQAVELEFKWQTGAIMRDRKSTRLNSSHVK